MCICVGEVLLVCMGRGGESTRESMCGRMMCVGMLMDVCVYDREEEYVYERVVGYKWYV